MVTLVTLVPVVPFRWFRSVVPGFTTCDHQGYHGINLSHKSMRQSGSLVTRLSHVGRSHAYFDTVTLGCLLFKISLMGSLWISCIFLQILSDERLLQEWKKF